MAKLRARVSAALQALTGKTTGQSIYASSTVRPHETHAYANRFRRMEMAEYAARYVGTVKVAASRNAWAIATTPLRLYKQAGTGKSSYKSEWVSRAKLLHLRTDSGVIASKAAQEADDLELVTDQAHPVNVILKAANPTQSGSDLLEHFGLGLGVFGNGYARKHTVAGMPVELWPLAAPFVHPNADRSSVISSYTYGRQLDIEATYPAEEIIHIKYANPKGDPYLGVGDLAACIAAADLDRTFLLFAQEMLENGATPGLAISAPQANAEQARALEDNLNARYAGPVKAGKSIVLWGENTIIPLNMGEKEMAFLSSGERVEALIASCFDMPVAILRLETAALATARESFPQWQRMAIKPRCKKIEDGLNRCLLEPHFPGYFLAFDNPVDKDLERTAVWVTPAYAGGLLTQNEARAELGFDSVDGGDEFKAPPPAPVGFGGGFGGQGGDDGSGMGADDDRGDRDGGDGGRDADGKSDGGGPGSVLPAGNAAVHKGKPKGVSNVPSGRGGKPEGEAREPGDEDRPADKSGGKSGVRVGGKNEVATDGIPAGAKVVSGTSDAMWLPHTDACCRPTRARKDDDKLVAGTLQAAERQLEAALRRWFEGVTPTLMENVTDKGLSLTLAQGDRFTGSFDTTVRDILNGLYTAGVRAGVDEVGFRVDPTKVREALTAGARDYLTNQEKRLSGSVLESLDGRLGDTLAEGVGQGETITELRDRVMETMESATKAGAENIARTETSRAYHSAREEAWKVSGIVEGKEWLLSRDPCQFCAAMAQQYKTVGLGEPFLPLGSELKGTAGGTMKIDYSTLAVPPLHPQCRCSLGAIFREV